MALTEFNPYDEPNTAQEEAEKAALEAGEKLVSAQQEDRLRNFEQLEAEQAPLAGKFKTAQDLEKAYLELQKKLGEKTPDSEEEPVEGQPEDTEEGSEEEAPEEEEEDSSTEETVNYMLELGQEYDKTGELSEEAIEKLSAMDPKDLIKSYLQYQQKATQAQIQQSEVNSIMESVGGADAYSEMIQWAGSNLQPAEIEQFNAVTNSGNAAAIRFAVEALSNRYRSAEGYEAPLVTGRKAPAKAKGFRSQAELARAISDPRYSRDPAYRQDVEEKLARSGDLL